MTGVATGSSRSTTPSTKPISELAVEVADQEAGPCPPFRPISAHVKSQEVGTCFYKLLHLLKEPQARCPWGFDNAWQSLSHKHTEELQREKRMRASIVDSGLIIG